MVCVALNRLTTMRAKRFASVDPFVRAIYIPIAFKLVGNRSERTSSEISQAEEVPWKFEACEDFGVRKIAGRPGRESLGSVFYERTGCSFRKFVQKTFRLPLPFLVRVNLPYAFISQEKHVPNFFERFAAFSHPIDLYVSFFSMLFVHACNLLFFIDNRQFRAKSQVFFEGGA